MLGQQWRKACERKELVSDLNQGPVHKMETMPCFARVTKKEAEIEWPRDIR